MSITPPPTTRTRRLVAPALVGALAVTGALAAGTTATADDGGGAFIGDDRCTISIAHAPLLPGGETGGIVWEAEAEGGVVDLDVAQDLHAAEQELAAAVAHFKAATQEERALTDALIAARDAVESDAGLAELTEQLEQARTALETARSQHDAAVADAERALTDARAAEEATDTFQTYTELADLIDGQTVVSGAPGETVTVQLDAPVMSWQLQALLVLGEGGGGGGGGGVDPVSTVDVLLPGVEGVYEVQPDGASNVTVVASTGWSTASEWYAAQTVPERDAVTAAEQVVADAQAARDEAVAAAEQAVADAEAAVEGHEANAAFKQAVAAFESVAGMPHDEVAAGGLGAITQPELWSDVEAALVGWFHAQRVDGEQVVADAHAAAVEASPFDRHRTFEKAIAAAVVHPVPGGEQEDGSIAVAHCGDVEVVWTAVEVPEGYAQPDDISIVLGRGAPQTDHTGISITRPVLGNIAYGLGESSLGRPFTSETQLWLPDGLTELPADDAVDQEPGSDPRGEDPSDRDDQGGNTDTPPRSDRDDNQDRNRDGSRDDRDGKRDDTRDGGRDRTGTPTRPDAPVTPPVPSN